MTSETMSLGAGARPLCRALGDRWWLFLVRGIAAVVFGVLTWIWPGISLVTLVLLYGAFALVDGVFALIGGIFGKAEAAAPRWWLIIVGLAGIGAGIIAFAWPGITIVVLYFFIAGWAIASGIFQIVGAIQLRKEIDNEWLLILSGIVSCLFGVALILMPGAGLLALIWLIGLYAVLAGILLIGFAFRVRKYKAA